MISFSQVHKRYRNGYEALKNINFSLEAGEMALITGHSGAGKTTLLRLIAAIERPTSGSIIVNGQNVSTLKGGAIPFLRRNLGLVFQDQKILFDRNVFQNVLFAPANKRVWFQGGDPAGTRGARQGRLAEQGKSLAYYAFRG